MTDVNASVNNTAETDDLNALDLQHDQVQDALKDIASAARRNASVIDGGAMTADDLIEQVLKDAKLMHVKTGNMLKDNQNLIGACLGAAVAVGLELVSPTGSKTSAAVAAVLSGATIVLAKPYLEVAPQSTGVAAAAAGLTAYVGMVGGRITADYFPGNLVEED